MFLKWPEETFVVNLPSFHNNVLSIKKASCSESLDAMTLIIGSRPSRQMALIRLVFSEEEVSHKWASFRQPLPLP
jgi:hypothetical protein